MILTQIMSESVSLTILAGVLGILFSVRMEYSGTSIDPGRNSAGAFPDRILAGGCRPIAAYRTGLLADWSLPPGP